MKRSTRENTLVHVVRLLSLIYCALIMLYSVAVADDGVFIVNGKYTDALWDENIDIISVDEDWGKEPDDDRLVGTLRANVSQDILNWLLDHDLDVKVLSNSKQMVMKF